MVHRPRTKPGTTIHEVQGETYDGLVILSRGLFGLGIFYSAISRARCLSLVRITHFNIRDWSTSNDALREYIRMRENLPISIETFNLSADERLQIAQKRVQNLGKVNKKLTTSVEWLKADHRTRSHDQRCDICIRLYKDGNAVPTTLKCGHTLCID